MISDKYNFNPSYIGKRKDVLNIIPDGAKKVLDVGCGIGTLGKQIKIKNKAEVVGIEIDVKMAEIAQNILDKVIIGDIENIKLEKHIVSEYFDCIIFADLLEHLKNPWIIVKKLNLFLKKEGVIIMSIPNIRHYTTIIDLLIRGYWPYRERGIHDKTHLRFFTLRNIRDMIENAELKITKINRNYRIIERPHKYNKFAAFFALPFFREFLTFQYIVIAKKK